MTITPETILFFILATISIVAALLMVTAQNPVRSALYLVLTFLCVAVFYVTLNAQFIAAVQIIVYAGAIMVLFLFVIMLLNLGAPQAVQEKGRLQGWTALVLGIAFAAALGAGPRAENRACTLPCDGCRDKNTGGPAHFPPTADRSTHRG